MYNPKMVALLEMRLGVDNLGEMTELRGQIRGRLTESQQGEVMEAINFASKRHEGQLRNDGRPQMTHPLEAMGFIITHLPDHPNLVPILQLVAMHDLYEDTDTSPEEIAAEFGKDMAVLVFFLSKKMLGQKVVDTDQEYFDRMTSSTLSQEAREMLAIAKTADRLQCNSTIDSLVPKNANLAASPLERQALALFKQIDYIDETREFILPLLPVDNPLRTALAEETNRQEALLGLAA